MPLASIIQADARVVNLNHLDFRAKLDFFLPEGKLCCLVHVFTEVYKQCLGMKSRITNEFCPLSNPVP